MLCDLMIDEILLSLLVYESFGFLASSLLSSHSAAVQDAIVRLFASWPRVVVKPRRPQNLRQFTSITLSGSSFEPFDSRSSRAYVQRPTYDDNNHGVHLHSLTLSATMPTNNDNEESRPMNDTTMPRRGKVSRRQERLKKGFGLSDWVRLTKSAKDLAMRGNAGLRRIPRTEVAEHDSVHDAWMILKNKVYNITPYLHYHPGGVSIFKSVLGKDGTELFDKYHPWVNIDGYVVVIEGV